MSTRRDFLKSSGMLVVGFGAMSVAPRGAFDSSADASGLFAQGGGPYPDPDFHQLDSWIVIRQDNTATFYVGKTDLGQGTGTAFRQIMTAKALLDRTPNPTDGQIREGMERTLCRCMTYYRIQAAIKRAARAMSGKGAV